MAAPEYKLIYFNKRGRGEVSRIILAYSGSSWEDKRVQPVQRGDEFLQHYKHKMPFGQLPVLEVEGVQIAQSHAIERFLAKRAGLMGKTDIEEAKVNMIVDGFSDYTSVLNRFFTERDPDRRQAIRTEILAEIAVLTQRFEKLIEGDGHFVGDKMTLADITAAHVLDGPIRLEHQTNWDDYPKLKAVREKVFTQPKIAEYLANRPHQPY